MWCFFTVIPEWTGPEKSPFRTCSMKGTTLKQPMFTVRRISALLAPAAQLKGCVSLLLIPIRLGWIALLTIVTFKPLRGLIATMKIWIRIPSRVARIPSIPALIPGAPIAIKMRNIRDVMLRVLLCYVSTERWRVRGTPFFDVFHLLSC